MKNIYRKVIIGFIASASLATFGGALVSMSSRSVVNAADNATSERLVTIYDRGDQQSIVTKASTVGEALDAAGVVVNDIDIVEPSKDQTLVASSYRINVYRARPVTVVDGNTRQKVMTPYQTPRQIAESAGIKIYPEDIANLDRTTNILADGAGLEMTIVRAKIVNLDLYGKQIVLRTQTKTVGDFLREKNINPSENDMLSVDYEAAITDQMSFRLWREGKQTISQEQPLAYETEEIQDADRLIGYRSVRTAGVNGVKNVTYEIDVVNGVEVSRKEIASVVLTAASKQVEVVGTKSPGLPYTGSGQKTDWLIASGISESDWGYVDYIISKESNWNPNSINKSSGACGLAQALPCSKVPGNPLDPVDNLKWADAYARTCVSYRMYCGWEGAYNFWLRNKWW